MLELVSTHYFVIWLPAGKGLVNDTTEQARSCQLRGKRAGTWPIEAARIVAMLPSFAARLKDLL